MSGKNNSDELCGGCIYYPPNLPREYYSPADWQALQAMECVHECLPASECCGAMRKTHCDLVDLREVQATLKNND